MLETTPGQLPNGHTLMNREVSEPDFRTEAAEMKIFRARRLVLPLTVTRSGASQTVTRAAIDQAINPTSTIAVETPSQTASQGWMDVLSSGGVGGYGDLPVWR